MAQGLRNRLTALENTNEDLNTKLQARHLIAKAVARLMIDCTIDEHEAFERIRSLSMRLNQSIESICQDIECHPPTHAAAELSDGIPNADTLPMPAQVSRGITGSHRHRGLPRSTSTLGRTS